MKSRPAYFCGVVCEQDRVGEEDNEKKNDSTYNCNLLENGREEEFRMNAYKAKLYQFFLLCTRFLHQLNFVPVDCRPFIIKGTIGYR